MNRAARELTRNPQKKQKNVLALDPSNMLAYRKYTQHVWSKLAKRPISADEADQIIEDFGRFLHALANENGEDL